MYFARRNVVTAAVLLALSAVPVAVYAQVSYSFNLPAQPLADALRAVGSQAGVNIVFEPATVQGRHALALKGNYSARQALDHLLSGSGLVLRTTQGGSFLVEMSNTTGASARPADKQVKRFDFHIQSQNLAATIRAIARTTGQRIDFDEALVSKKKADAISGQLTAVEALQQALSETGLHAAVTSSGTLAILPGPPGDVEQLPTVIVQARVESLSATRVPTALREIPQSVSVISQDTLQQQNDSGLADALTWATGINVQQQTATDSTFLSRGFEIGEVHIDGGGPVSLQQYAIADSSSPVNDLSEYDHVEVLRGSDALFGGAGNPGATLSLERKRPQADAEASVTATVGSYNYYREVFDATGPLGFDGALRGRVVASNTDQDYFYDLGHRKQHKLYGILEYDLTPKTMLTVGGSIELVDAVPSANGLPRYIDGGDPHLPRSTALVFPWNQAITHNDEAFAQVNHQFSDDWKLKIGATLLKQDSDSNSGGFGNAGINPVTNTIPAPEAINATESNLALSGDATLTGAFDWGGNRQEVIVGMDYSRQRVAIYDQLQSLIGPPVDPWSFDPTLYDTIAPVSPETPVISENISNYSKQVGGYAALRLHFWDGWSAILGARDNYYRDVSTFSEKLELGPPIGTFGFSQSPINNVSTGVVTPYAGLTYDINKRYTLYASYADIFQPNAGQITPEGSALPAMRGVNLEVGAKAAWFDGLLNGSFAIFKINQRNNPAYVNSPNLGNLQNCCYLPGDNTSKGIDTELSGHLTPSWQIGAGYTFDVNRQNANVTNVPGVPGGLLSTVTPKHILKVWTNYQLPGVADRWSLGGGVRAQSSSYSIGYACPVSDSLGNCLGASVPYDIRQGFYTVVTLRAAYVINTHWSVSLNVDNLFDRTYYQTLGLVTGNNWYGSPRSFMMTIRGQL